jgi:hypothetical protein
VRLRNVQRDPALFQHHIMKRAHIKPAAQFFLGSRAQLPEFHLSDLVSQRLARPNNVAIDFHRNVMVGLARVLTKIIESLLPRLTHRVDARIDYQPHGSPHLVGQLPEF